MYTVVFYLVQSGSAADPDVVVLWVGAEDAASEEYEKEPEALLAKVDKE
jgi:hypothetical protein